MIQCVLLLPVNSFWLWDTGIGAANPVAPPGERHLTRVMQLEQECEALPKAGWQDLKSLLRNRFPGRTDRSKGFPIALHIMPIWRNWQLKAHGKRRKLYEFNKIMESKSWQHSLPLPSPTPSRLALTPYPVTEMTRRIQGVTADSPAKSFSGFCPHGSLCLFYLFRPAIGRIFLLLYRQWLPKCRLNFWENISLKQINNDNSLKYKSFYILAYGLHYVGHSINNYPRR